MPQGSLNHPVICGVDEVGRGPLAGPVVAAAVILDPHRPIEGLNDSKLLSPSARLRLFSEILDKCAGYGIAGVSCLIIDKVNILQASLLAMKYAVEKLRLRPDKIYIDGTFIIPGLAIDQEAVKGADRSIAEVAAASILAKVARDAYMIKQAEIYPDYGFENHKGYATEEHLKAIAKVGPCKIHRRSFRPISQFELWEN